jgi:hypothetical protein
MEQANTIDMICRRNKAQIWELLQEFDKDHGLSVKDFCRLHKISEGAFYAARKRYRSKSKSKQKPSGFIAIAQPSSKASSAVLFAEVNGIRLYQAVSADYLKSLMV